MEILAAGLGSLFTAGGAAAATAGVATQATGLAAAGVGAGAAAGSGLSLMGILQGVATVGGIAASLSAGSEAAHADAMAAADAEQEQQLETLQGIDRRRSIRAAMRDAVGSIGSAYAASGVDLTFGTASEARKEAYREADLGITSDGSTESVRIARLSERAANYRASAKRAKRMGVFNAVVGGAREVTSMARRY